MPSVHAHEAVLELEADADPAAPGGAVTVALCGHWQHAGRCRWPHRTSVVSRVGRALRLRVLFAAPPSELHEVRSRISAGLSRGELTGPDGRVTRWRVLREGVSQPLAGEEPLAGERGQEETMGGDPVVPETKGVSVKLLATVDLGPEIEGMEGRQLRMRLVTIEPGGVFGPLHDHKDRPGTVYVLQGTITDHRDGVATDYGPGPGWPEDRNTTHWLENQGAIPAVEISVDIVRQEQAASPPGQRSPEPGR